MRRRWRPGTLWLTLPGLAYLLVFLVLPCLRLLSLGFEETRVECDLWRPAGLRAAESLLFREGAEAVGSKRPSPA